jgi:hypothetical protein
MSAILVATGLKYSREWFSWSWTLDLKIATIIPVYKKDSRFTLSNYRPISLLSIFNKLFEKLVSIRLLDFLEKNNIFFDKQFGFRNKYSTEHAILNIVDKIQRAIDAGKNFPVEYF